MGQVIVVTAAGSVIAFIVRDLGEASVSGWIIQVGLSLHRPSKLPEPGLPDFQGLWTKLTSPAGLSSVGAAINAKRALPHRGQTVGCV